MIRSIFCTFDDFGVEESLLNKISSYIQRLIYYIHIFVGIYSCVCLFIRVKYF